ncbi:MAG: carboxypeptidase-like regulatory domain-containing protein, partial [Chitinophagaceae bacterium]|nr:carboxypeptidase-like regulatory domain-containing protein [Chitinophagaceae bacterium]
MRLIFLLSCLMIFVGVQAQSFSGTVLSADGKQPVAFASVYLSNTSIGTTTNSSGVFTFQNFPKGRFDLIVSC